MELFFRNKKHTTEIALYTEGFDVKRFLEIIPDPDEKFTNPTRQLSLNENANDNDEKYALNFLYNHYRFIRMKYIDMVFRWEQKNLVAITDRLDRLSKSLKKARPAEAPSVNSENVPLLQVVKYFNIYL